ncbi:MAG: hypothetical protein ABSH03_09145 [Candidatus Lustribacter sp.]
MSRIVVLGEGTRVAPFALAGAGVVAAEDAPSVCAAWRALAADVAIVVLTPAAAAAVAAAGLTPRAGALAVTLP